MNERRYGWAAAVAAQLLNLNQLEGDQPKAIKFQKVASLVEDAMKLSEMEFREKMLRPSNN